MRFFVNTAAARVLDPAKMAAKSGLPLALMPALTAENLKPLGRNIGSLAFAVILAVSPESWRVLEGSQTSEALPYHRDFVTIVITRTNTAVFVDLVRQVFTLGNLEPELGKKLR